MATQPALMSIEEYLHTSYSPDVDFVDGILEERNLGACDHGRLQGLIFAYFNAHRRTYGLIPVVEQRIRVAPDRVRICDVVLIRTDAPREQVTQTPPAVCIEILSPEDRLQRAQVVLEDYREMGVEHIWLLDPLRRVTYTFGPQGLQLQTAPLRMSGTDISLDVEMLFAEIDE